MTEKVSAGKPFTGPSSPLRSAAFVNDVIETVDYHQQTQRLGKGKPAIDSGPPPTDTVRVKNLSGSNLVRGSVVKLTTYLHTSINRFAITFGAVAPTAPADLKFAILLEPLPTDAFGFAQTTGTCPAFVNVTNTAHTHATPVVADAVMDSAASGPVEILSPLSGTGEQMVVVRIGEAATGQYGGMTLAATGLALGAGTVKVLFDTAEQSSGVTADTANNQFTILAAGTYIIDWSGIIVESNNVAETATFKVYKNGSDLGAKYHQGGHIQNAIKAWAFSSPPTALAAGDLISLYLTTGLASQMLTNGMNIRVRRWG